MNPLDDRIAPLAASVAGGVSGALVMARAKLVCNWREFASVAVVGILFAVFLVPAICEALHIQSITALTAAGYLGGAFGNLLMTGLIAYIAQHRGSLAAFLLARLLHITPSEMPTASQSQHTDRKAKRKRGVQ